MSAPRLVLVHGFTQTGRSFAPLRMRLDGYEMLAPDLPGHGPTPDPATDLWDAAERLGQAGGKATYLGYSMGGRVALHLALARPDLVERLVLIGATAGIEDDDERAARRAADAVLATELEHDGVDAFLDRWLAQPHFAGLTPEAAGRQARGENTASGLADALRHLGTGNQEPLWGRLLDIAMPVLLVAGERDERFCELAMRMGAWIGGLASLAMVPAAGHACHLERPDAFADLLRPWLAEGHAH
ncbi:MAG: alpha/beta fold hydrolase [Acidimicrobiales bacterium]